MASQTRQSYLLGLERRQTLLTSFTAAILILLLTLAIFLTVTYHVVGEVSTGVLQHLTVATTLSLTTLYVFAVEIYRRMIKKAVDILYMYAVAHPDPDERGRSRQWRAFDAWSDGFWDAVWWKMWVTCFVLACEMYYVARELLKCCLWLVHAYIMLDAAFILAWCAVSAGILMLVGRVNRTVKRAARWALGRIWRLAGRGLNL